MTTSIKAIFKQMNIYDYSDSTLIINENEQKFYENLLQNYLNTESFLQTLLHFKNLRKALLIPLF